jgi:hypothetical protein
MLNIEVFRDICRSVSTEKDPAKLRDVKEALRFMLLAEGISVRHVEKSPGSKPN